MYRSVIFLLFLSLAFYGNCQSSKIISDTKQFDYLIGKEYTNISELGDFESKSSGGQICPDGKKYFHTNLTYGDQQIITSEIFFKSANSTPENHKIYDIIVLNDRYSTCTGCLLSKNNKSYILTIHPYGIKDNAPILKAFRVSRKTGKFNQVNPKKFKINPNVPEGMIAVKSNSEN